MKPYGARGASELSHERLPGWSLVELGETIPYESVFVPAKYKLTTDDIRRGQEIAGEHGLLAPQKT
jgi:hypothetical protein